MAVQNQEEDGCWVLYRGRKRATKVRWEALVSVFVVNMPESTSAEWLRAVFSWFGKVIDAFIPLSSRRGKVWCFGFVRLREYSLPLKAVKAMNGCSLGGRRLTIKIASFGWLKRRPSTRTHLSEEKTFCVNPPLCSVQSVGAKSVVQELCSGART